MVYADWGARSSTSPAPVLLLQLHLLAACINAVNLDVHQLGLKDSSFSDSFGFVRRDHKLIGLAKQLGGIPGIGGSIEPYLHIV